MRVRTTSESSISDPSQLGTEGAPATNRTITDMIELTTSLPQTVLKPFTVYELATLTASYEYFLFSSFMPTLHTVRSSVIM